MVGPPGSFSWRRLPQYEIAHADAPLEAEGWEHGPYRNRIIARRAAVALAGGAAECCATGADLRVGFIAKAVYAWTGSVDFELAHEWLTLQRYDGDQAAIEADICRLFLEVCQVLSEPLQHTALRIVSKRILAHLEAADEQGVGELRTASEQLLNGVLLDPPPDFDLGATLASSPDGPRGLKAAT
jgi:hypothetical protein